MSGARFAFSILPTFSDLRAFVHLLTGCLEREMRARLVADLVAAAPDVPADLSKLTNEVGPR